jgi:hypothetical protein
MLQGKGNFTRRWLGGCTFICFAGGAGAGSSWPVWGSSSFRRKPPCL